MGDGKFGAAYAQEDGVAFKEESTGNNERIGKKIFDNYSHKYNIMCQVSTATLMKMEMKLLSSTQLASMDSGTIIVIVI